MGLFSRFSGKGTSSARGDGGRAFQETSDRPRPVVRLGTVQQVLLSQSMSLQSLGSVHAETCWKAGSDWPGAGWGGVHEAGWRTATARLRGVATSLGANAVLNLRYQLGHSDGVFSFVMQGDAMFAPQLGSIENIPCVPWNAATFDIALKAGIVPCGYAVGTYEEVSYPGFLTRLTEAWSIGENTLLTQTKRAARDAAAYSLRNDPACGDWDGALGHDEIVDLVLRKDKGVIRSMHVRAAVRILGYRRITSRAEVQPVFFQALEEALLPLEAHRPTFVGVSNGITVEDEADGGNATGIAAAEIGAEVFQETTESFGGFLDDLGDLFGSKD